MSTQQTIIDWLFATQAIRVSPADQPFWYTSGTLGPYYINTHFLYGNEASANDLLNRIEIYAANPLTMPTRLASVIMQQYQQNPIFHQLMDLVVTTLEDYSFDAISGGERRDFFFSIPAACLMGKPHVTILKNGETYLSNSDMSNTRALKHGALKNQKILHIADLVTEASSYARAWLPAIRELGGNMADTLAIVDRDQGGRELLAKEGTTLVALTKIDKALFSSARDSGLVNEDQYQQILAFMDDPHAYMTAFFAAHPDFLAKQLNLGGKAAERAQRCIEQGYGQA
jgi:adenine/guanine phosphoribosyltransferase-like PRPP-binding protein